MSWDATRPAHSRAQRTMRDRVLREEPTCRVDGCDEPSVEDDHIVPWSQREAAGMTVAEWHARPNHQGLCGPHHQAKTARESLAGRHQSKRSRRVHPSEVGGTPRR